MDCESSCSAPRRPVRAMVPIVVASCILQRQAIDCCPDPLVLLLLLIDLELSGGGGLLVTLLAASTNRHTKQLTFFSSI